MQFLNNHIVHHQGSANGCLGDKQFCNGFINSLIENRFEFPALERTSIEVLTAFENSGKVENEKIEWLKQIFTVADFVKFAKLKPTVDENEISMDYAHKFVQNTKPKPKVTPQSTTDNNQERVDADSGNNNQKQRITNNKRNK